MMNEGFFSFLDFIEKKKHTLHFSSVKDNKEGHKPESKRTTKHDNVITQYSTK